jgi:hypothetical protein
VYLEKTFEKFLRDTSTIITGELPTVRVNENQYTQVTDYLQDELTYSKWDY